jgi:hypothetical protein
MGWRSFKILMDLFQQYPHININLLEEVNVSAITSSEEHKRFVKYRDLNKQHDAVIVSQMLETSEWMMENGSAAALVDPKICHIIASYMPLKQQKNWEELCQLLGYVTPDSEPKFRQMLDRYASLDSVYRALVTSKPSKIDPPEKFLSLKDHFGFLRSAASCRNKNRRISMQ